MSISDRYNSTSRQLLVKFLQTHVSTPTLAGWCARRILQRCRVDTLVQRPRHERLGDVSSLIRRIEPDGKDIPVLFRQYLKLKAKLLGFTVDRIFGNVIDGLVVVDLDSVEPTILRAS